MLYVAVANSGHDKNKLIKAQFCTLSSINEIINSAEYDLYSGEEGTFDHHPDIILKLQLKDSRNEITVGVPEQDGDKFPINTEDFATVFGIN